MELILVEMIKILLIFSITAKTKNIFMLIQLLGVHAIITLNNLNLMDLTMLTKD